MERGDDYYGPKEKGKAQNKGSSNVVDHASLHKSSENAQAETLAQTAKRHNHSSKWLFWPATGRAL
jgi:hypothetical protein